MYSGMLSVLWFMAYAAPIVSIGLGLCMSTMMLTKFSNDLRRMSSDHDDMVKSYGELDQAHREHLAIQVMCHLTARNKVTLDEAYALKRATEILHQRGENRLYKRLN